MEDKSRSLYTHEEYISLVLNSGSGLSHDYVSQSIQEDPRMMAFFDSLVRREIEGWSSDSDSDLSEEAIMQLHARGRRSTRPVATAPPAASASVNHSDSESSSSSCSLAPPEASGGEDQSRAEGETEVERPRRRSRFPWNQSGFLLNEDSDSSEFWLDPMPRPRSPSPRDNSTISSPASSPSLPVGASSSSTSTSSSSSDDEERRSAVRRRNVVRRHRMNVVSRAGDRPEPVQALFSAVDSCSYPSIAITDPSSSSSGDERKPQSSNNKEEQEEDIDTCLSPSEFVCLSPDLSPESQDNEEGFDRTEVRRRSTASPRSLDGHRTGGGAAPEPALDSSDGGEECNAPAAADCNSQNGRSPGVNGQHRTVASHGSENRSISSDSEAETGDGPEDRRSWREKRSAQNALKRTHVGSEEAEAGCSPSEKKIKT